VISRGSMYIEVKGERMKKLNGSEKQVAWAEEIRETLLNGHICQGTCVNEGIKQHMAQKEELINLNIEDLENETDENEIKEITEENEMYKKELDLFVALKNKIESETSAVWFIDNRNNHKLFVKEIFSK